MNGACVTTGGGAPVRVSWLAPNFGSPIAYWIYRIQYAEDPFVPPAVLPTQQIAIVSSESGPPPTSYLDNAAPAGARLAYFVIAQYPAGAVANPFSGVSNFATVATPTPALMLAFITQPASTQAGQTMSVVRVAIQSASGALVSLSDVPITLGFGANPSAATLAGTTTQNTVEGVATFNNLSINNVGTGYTLVASAPARSWRRRRRSTSPPGRRCPS